MEELLKQVPKELRERFAEIVAITDRFCDEHLNEEYKELCREMTVGFCQKGSPVTSGKALSWASGIIGAIGWVNFLSDPSQTPHLKTDEVARLLGVSAATLAAKTKVLREGFDLGRMDPRWSLPSTLEHNPLVWMVQDKHGMIYDLRQAPRHVQEEAHWKGLIPFIPGHQEDKD
jgi:hypothetical protein